MIAVGNVPSSFKLADVIRASGNQLESILFAVIGLAAVFFIILAGIKYIQSNGSPDKVKAARQNIISVIIGVVIALSTYAIIRFAALTSAVGTDILAGNFTVDDPSTSSGGGSGATGAAAISAASIPDGGVRTYRQEALKVFDRYIPTSIYNSAGELLNSNGDIWQDGQPKQYQYCYRGADGVIAIDKCIGSGSINSGQNPNTPGPFYVRIRSCFQNSATLADIYGCVEVARGTGKTDPKEWICRDWNIEKARVTALPPEVRTADEKPYLAACPYGT